MTEVIFTRDSRMLHAS